MEEIILDQEAVTGKSLAGSGVKAAGFGLRLVAFCIDSFIIFALMILTVLVQHVFFKGSTGETVSVLIMIVIYPGYYIYLPLLLRATLGKLICRLTLTGASGQRLSPRQAMLRAMPHILIMAYLITMLFISRFAVASFKRNSFITYDTNAEWPGFVFLGAVAAFFVADGLSILFNKNRRALHDLLAKTCCIRKRQG